MATIAKLEAVLLAQTDHFDRGMARSESKMHHVGKAAGVAGLAIIGGLAVGLEKSVHAAIDAQASQARLAQSFKNVHLSLGAYKESLDAAESSGRKLGFTDTQTREAIGSLLPATKNYAAAIADLGVAQNLARFKGVSLVDSTKMLTMAMTGSQRAAKQLGITVSPVTKNMDALAKGATHAEKAHAKLLDKMATGQAVIAATSALVHGHAAALGPAALAAQVFHAQVEHLQATIGEKLLPALTKVLEKVTAFVSYLSAHPHVAKALAIGLAAAAVAMIALSVATTLFNVAAAPEIALIAAIVIGIAALALGFAYAWRHSERFRDIVKGVISAVVGYFKDVVANASSMASGVAGAFHTIEAAIKGVITWVRDLIHWITHIVGKTVDFFINVHLPGGKTGKALDLILSGAKDLAFNITGIHHRAMGGPVSQGQPYMVGERGPELFVPRGGGTIVPNGGGGSIVHNHNYNGPVIQDEKFLAYLQALDKQFRRRNGRPAFGT